LWNYSDGAANAKGHVGSVDAAMSWPRTRDAWTRVQRLHFIFNGHVTTRRYPSGRFDARKRYARRIVDVSPEIPSKLLSTGISSYSMFTYCSSMPTSIHSVSSTSSSFSSLPPRPCLALARLTDAPESSPHITHVWAKRSARMLARAPHLSFSCSTASVRTSPHAPRAHPRCSHPSAVLPLIFDARPRGRRRGSSTVRAGALHRTRARSRRRVAPCGRASAHSTRLVPVRVLCPPYSRSTGAAQTSSHARPSARAERPRRRASLRRARSL
jgi:hypothetical protein